MLAYIGKDNLSVKVYDKFQEKLNEFNKNYEDSRINQKDSVLMITHQQVLEFMDELWKNSHIYNLVNV